MHSWIFLRNVASLKNTPKKRTLVLWCCNTEKLRSSRVKEIISGIIVINFFHLTSLYVSEWKVTWIYCIANTHRKLNWNAWLYFPMYQPTVTVSLYVSICTRNKSTWFTEPNNDVLSGYFTIFVMFSKYHRV